MFELEYNFGERLREERNRLFFTQEKLAEQTNVRPLSISQYENGHSSPTIKFIYALEKLHFDIYYLLLGTRKNHIPKDYSPELCKKVAKEVDLLELKLGESLTSEARVKVITSLLNHYEFISTEQSSNHSVSNWLSKILLKL